ncbi:hypothetical protein KW784_01040, partial [Candidatus Parcubacteria bacterium]|nr:hypothetical protein [Candidatus Parcubacteria bacterium]
WPFTKQADNAQATSTLLELFGGLYTNASSTLASTTVTSLLSNNATATDLYVGNLASTTQLRANVANIGNLTVTACTGCGSGSMTFAYPFVKLATGENATSTTLEFNNGFVSTASSTLATTTISNMTIGTTTSSNALFTLQGIMGYDMLRFASSTGTTVLSVTPFGGLVQRLSSTTALDIQNNAGNSVFSVDTTQSSTGAGIDITAGASQSGNLLNIFKSDGVTPYVAVDSTGGFLVTASTTLQSLYATSLNIGSTSANNLGIVNINTAQTLKKNVLWIAGSAADATTTMVITNNGLVGFGATTSPTAQFSIHTASSSPTNGSRQFIFSIGSSSPKLSTGAQNAPVTLFAIDTSGRIYASSTRPTLTTCGTSPTIQGTDSDGLITLGTSAHTVCVMTFSRTWGNAPFCVVSASAKNAKTARGITAVASTTATTLAIGASATTSATVMYNIADMLLYYHCVGNIE